MHVTNNGECFSSKNCWKRKRSKLVQVPKPTAVDILKRRLESIKTLTVFSAPVPWSSKNCRGQGHEKVVCCLWFSPGLVFSALVRSLCVKSQRTGNQHKGSGGSRQWIEQRTMDSSLKPDVSGDVLLLQLPY